MVISVGEKVHAVYRALYENSGRRHFIGEVTAAEGAVCRIFGYVFVYDTKTTVFVRKPEKRTTIMDLSESGYIVNVLDPGVDLDGIVYKYEQDLGLVAKDGRGLVLSINEFGNKS